VADEAEMFCLPHLIYAILFHYYLTKGIKYCIIMHNSRLNTTNIANTTNILTIP